MDDSQSEPRVFSVRIVSIDYYMAPPIPGYDICYSNFQGGMVNEVPVIRIYGSTPGGQKTCLHVHRALPHLFVPCSDIPLDPDGGGDAFTLAISLQLEKALKLKGNAGLKRQHVHGCEIVKAKNLYGYHSSEEAFVKIYIYYPHDVARAASLLLAGACFGKSLQPYESHIPFILQFLVDYNLYGMGHVHVSQMKFRHPMPDNFQPRRFSNHCPGNLQADSNTGASFSSPPVWNSSTVPGDWMWHLTAADVSPDHQMHHYRRQSCCELEGDVVVNDILNQQSKMFNSLSQTQLDVKMVQSLVAIWEEEYERTGMCVAAIPPDPGKPSAKDVLKILLPDADIESRLRKLYDEVEDSPALPQHLKSMVVSSAFEGNIVGDTFVEPVTPHPPKLYHAIDRNTSKFISTEPLENREIDETPSGGKFASRILSYGDVVRPSEGRGSPDIVGTDEEAVRLLKWFASSQEAEDINSDDELLRECILSPLLPVSSLDKVLEKANADYESQSQKECQDILDSVEDITVPKNSEERASCTILHANNSHLLIDKSLPEIGDFSDASNFSMSDGSSENSFKRYMKSGSKRMARCRGLPDTSRMLSTKRQGINPLWGPLPFSLTKNLNCEFEACSSDITETWFGGTKGSSGASSAGGKLDNVDVCKSKNVRSLDGCSVRDLMRQKRLRQKESLDKGPVKLEKFLADRERNNHFSLPEQPCGSSESLANICLETKRQESALGNKLESSCTNNYLANETPKRKVPPFPNYLPDMAIGGNISDDVHIISPEAKTSMELGCKSFVNKTVDIDMITNTNKPGCEEEGDVGLSFENTTVTMARSMVEKIENLVCMKLSKRPPAFGWDGATLEDISKFNANEYNHEGSERDAREVLPFFFENTEEVDEDRKKYFENSSCNERSDEAIMGVPLYYLNDGSSLFLLTPALSAPSVDSVSRWLSHDEGSLDCKITSERHSAFDKYKEAVTIPNSHTAISGQANLLDNVILKAEPSAYPGANPSPKNDRKVTELDTQTIVSLDISQISGPDGKLNTTPLSQTGFRDPASTGAGQQLTSLSIEILAESRENLKPDPQFDAVNVIAFVAQNDNDSVGEAFVLLRSESGSSKRDFDGIPGCKAFIFLEEKLLFTHFVEILRTWDPDIIMGWDIQGSSLGFLAERAAKLGIRLLDMISRTPSDIVTFADNMDMDEKGNISNLMHDPLSDCVQVEEAIIEDEWGRTHASGVHVGGRVVLNVWRLMRGEVKLKMYSIEAVAEAVLRRKIPLIPHKVLTKWFLSGPGCGRYRCIEYVIQRANLNLEIMNQLDMINRTSELARVFGIDFFSVLSRGSQYRVESMFLRLAHTQNYLAISPGNQQVASQPAMECLPLVMEPESGFYADPVIVLDFQSLYPSMIIAYNLCYCTCLGKITNSKVNKLGVSSYAPEKQMVWDLKSQILLTPNGVMYLPPQIRRGILPRLLEEILSTRIMVKQGMKKLDSSEQVLNRIFNARQLALKLIANVTYGYTAAGFSGRMPCAELADSIVQCGRSTLEKAISFVNANEKWMARVVYGDTDSMFVLLKGRTIKEAFQIGQEIASAVTAMNPDPVTLKFEKVYHPCFLLTKKRYVGYSYGHSDQIEPTFDAKGIETVRRDTCEVVSKAMEQSLRLYFEHQNLSKVKTYLYRQWKRILYGKVSLQDFVFAKEVRLGTYSSRDSSLLPPAAIVATKAMKTDPRAEPRYAERVPYVVIHGELGARLVDMVVDPLDLLDIDSPYRLNDSYYINKQIIPALQRVFGLVGADLNQWFFEMPRSARESFGKRPSLGQNQQRTRIDYYYLSKHCVVCGEMVQASAHLCDKCLRNESAVTTAIIGRTARLEKEIQHLAAICRGCGGGDWVTESGVKCISLACSVFYERRKTQKELKGVSSVASEKGLYPKCMVEWF